MTPKTLSVEETIMLPPLEFVSIFWATPTPYLVLLPDTPKFTIVAVNDAYLKATMTERRGEKGILGRGLFEVFPDNPNEIAATGTRNLKASLATVLKTKQAHTMLVQKYDIPVPGSADFEERFWCPVNIPVISPEGDIRYIIHSVEDVTEAARLSNVLKTEGHNTDQLKTRNSWLESEIQNRTKAEALRDKLLASERAARQFAEEANRTKSAFLAKMSHEIRTPINAIIGYTELVTLGLDGPITEAQRDHLNRIVAVSRHLLGLVNELLDVTKIETGAIAVDRLALSANALAEEALALTAPGAQAKGIALDSYLPSEPVMVWGDEVRVRQILVNLLGNAVKFSDAGASVKLTISASATPTNPPRPIQAHDAIPGVRWVCFKVEDTGIGIPGSLLDKIFEPFTQAETGLTRTHDGVGLGLAISRDLARLMGGDITVQSTPGLGSAFTVWLPEAPAPNETTAD